MKNAKRILLFALALVALTLVMSLSIFAEETTEEPVACEHTYDWHIGGCPKCGTVAVPDTEGGKVSTNLGFSVFFAANWSEINANVSASSTYKVIKLTADTTVPSGNNYAKVQNANILIDLGGHSITSSVGLAPLYLYAADALVNGTIIHNYGRQALYVCNVNKIENINIVVGGTFSNNTTGIYLASNASWAAGFENSTGSYIGSMKNVTIDSKRDENGNYIDNIGLFNHGIEFSNAGSIIGDLENVKVYSRGQAITIMAKQIGTMTNCVFDGTNIGMNIGNLQCDINLVNCVVSSETLAVRIGGASSNTLSFNFDENTAISSNGSVYYIPDNIKGYEGFKSLTTAVALVNGVLYGTLEDALAAVLASTEEVTTFTLIGDLTLAAPIEINKNVNFSFGGGTFKIPTTGDKTFTEMTAPGYTVTAPNGAFVVVEGGALTITGDGTLEGNENAIVANGGNVLVAAGTYVGYDPSSFVSSESCVANNDGTYTIAKNHTYDDGVLSDKVTYGVDGVCNNCGYVRGIYAVDYVYYATIEEALAAALASGKQIVLAADIVIDEATVWDFTGATFNFNSLTITSNGNLSIVGGTFTQDVSEYVSDEYCTYKNNKNLYEVVSAHEWGPAVGGSDATCTKPGIAVIACVKCGLETEEETSAKLPHTYDWHIGGCPMCGTVAVPDVEGGKISTNLGYTVYFAASWSEINSHMSTAKNAEELYVIRLTADTTASGYAKVENANILIDLGGHSITTSLSNASLYMYAAKGLVNGTLVHNAGRQGLWMANVGFIEDINIIMGGTFANNATAILLSNNATYGGSNLGWMKNVTIDSKRDENGNYIDNIGLFNHGLEFSNAASIIGTLENVKVYSRGQAITIMAKQIGTMTNCVFDGTNIGLNIGNLQCDINLVNCVVSSETLAVRIGGASSNTLSFNFDADTAISSNGSVYYIPDNIKGYEGFESLTTAVALVNGVLYGTLEDALAAVLASTEEVTTFTLIGDLTLATPIEINKNVNFSFGGGTFKIPTTGDKTFTEMTAAGYTVTAPNGAFVVVEGGALTITGDGTLVGNENAIVANGGNVLVAAGTYVGFNPEAFVADDACVADNNGTYTISTHTYDDGVLSDKVTYGVDGVCNVCGYVRGIYAVDYVYYATLEEALEAALASGKSIVLAADIVLDGEVVWDLTGATFNYNGLTVTVNGSLSIVGGTFTQDVSEYVSDEYCTYKNNKNLYVVVAAHSYEAVVTAPDCVNDGYTTYTCTACGNSYVDNYVDATGHNYTEETVEPTCTEEGYVKNTCSVCGEVAISDEKTPALGHTGTYGDDYVYVGATCVAPGYISDVCSVCSEEFTTILPIDTEYGHDWDDGSRNEADTGIIYTCKLCGATKEEITLGTAAEPIEIVIGENVVPTINNPEALDIWFYLPVTEYGKYTITVAETVGVKHAPNAMALYRAQFEYGKTTYEIVVDPSNGNQYPVVFTTDVTSFNVTFEAMEYPTIDLGENALVGSTAGNKYVVKVPGEYILSAAEGETNAVVNVVVVHPMFGTMTEWVDLPYTFTVNEGETVTFIINTGDWSEEDEINLVLSLAHTHTEEEIPAVLPLPSNNHVGKTAGVKCAECGEVLVAPVEVVAGMTSSWKTFGINDMALALSNGISLNYNVNVASGYTNPYMVFIYEGEEYIWTEYSGTGKLITFTFNHTRPHKMDANVEAYVYGETADGYVMDTIPEFSIMEYAKQALVAYKNQPATVTLICDILAYGAAVQKYRNPAIAESELVTSKMAAAGYTLTPTEYTGIEGASKIKYEDKEPLKYYWDDVQLMLGSNVVMYFNFQAPDIDGLKVKVEYSDQMYIIENDAIVSTGANKYRVEVDTIAPAQHIYDVKVTFITAEGTEASSMSASINGYLSAAMDLFSGETQDLMKALFVYGESVRAYLNS